MAVEADKTLPAVLAQTCARDGERLVLIEGDALKVDPARLVAAAGRPPTKLVSNLPYQVAATVVLGALQQMPSVGRLVVMVQAEVADRIAARPGTREYGAYTAKLSLFGRVSGRFEVGPHNFVPPPHVDSAVVRIDRLPAWGTGSGGGGTGMAADDLAHTCDIIDAAFAQRRKTLRNSLAAKGFSKPDIDSALEAAGIDGRVRAEVLTPEDFVRLSAFL